MKLVGIEISEDRLKESEFLYNEMENLNTGYKSLEAVCFHMGQMRVIYKNKCCQVRQLTPVIPVLWGAEAGGSLEARSSRPPWSTW